METSAILLVSILFLGATALCVVLFDALGFGSLLGFIVAGILIGPHTPGPIRSESIIHELEAVAEIGVILFMFTVGLEMRPEKVWSMRRLLFGLGSAQMLVTAAGVGAYSAFVVGDAWDSALILGLGLAMSSTAIVLTTLQERGELGSESGKATFAVLMAQDLWIVPIMALVPILAHTTAETTDVPAWRTALLVLGSLAGIYVVGRYLLPIGLSASAHRQRLEAFAILLFLAVLAAAWVMDFVGISMTLGAFLMGMLLSVSDYRHQIEATVEPFKSFLMGLFFIAVGMSIDIGALVEDWSKLMVHVPVVIAIKVAVLIGLTLAFGLSRPAAARTGLYLSQSGELAFVLFGAAAAVDLLPSGPLTLAMLVVAVSMILTPFLMKAGDRLAERLKGGPPPPSGAGEERERHVVVVGFDEVGQLVCLMLEKLQIPYVAFDDDASAVERGRRWGKHVEYGNMQSPLTQQAASLGKALAVFVSRPSAGEEGLASTLHRLYPTLPIFARARTLREQGELLAQGISHADTGFVEVALARGSALLQQVGVSQSEVEAMIDGLRHDNYALIMAAEAELHGQPAG